MFCKATCSQLVTFVNKPPLLLSCVQYVAVLNAHIVLLAATPVEMFILVPPPKAPPASTTSQTVWVCVT